MAWSETSWPALAQEPCSAGPKYGIEDSSSPLPFHSSTRSCPDGSGHAMGSCVLGGTMCTLRVPDWRSAIGNGVRLSILYGGSEDPKR
eukprot:scaffold2939_cov406-Prasinococcus_capsulatus_cf.AAC.8